MYTDNNETYNNYILRFCSNLHGKVIKWLTGSNRLRRSDMIKHLVMGLVLVGFGNHAVAHVTTMTNNELDEVVLPTQEQGQLQPVLPQYDANGQIGSVAAEMNPTSIGSMQSIRVDTSATNPVMPTLPPAVVAQLNQIFNIASQGR